MAATASQDDNKVLEVNNLKTRFHTQDGTVFAVNGVSFNLHEGELLGIITDRDICCKVVATGRDAGWTKVHEVMHKEITTCFDDQDINDAAELMANQHIRRLAVLSRDNSMTGFLSVDDLARGSYELAGTVLEATSTAH